jgi:hypothetical protein
VFDEPDDGMAQNINASQGKVLLGQGASEPASLTRRDDESIDGRHFKKLACAWVVGYCSTAFAVDVALQKESV